MCLVLMVDFLEVSGALGRLATRGVRVCVENRLKLFVNG